MTKTIKQEAQSNSLLDTYLTQIPSHLCDILAPESGQEADFIEAVKSLRIKEEERSYVMTIQQRYDLPLRPNESVKRTMIRVRLLMLKKLKDAAANGEMIDPDYALPVDPLE